jgi:hypothetical protein
VSSESRDNAPLADDLASLIVVTGLPRSGTSMLMQMLEAGGVAVLSDGLRGPDANNPRGYFELERIKSLHRDADTSWLASGRGKAVKIVSHLLRYLPDHYSYRVIFMQRSLREVVASQDRMLDNLGRERGSVDEDRLMAAYDAHLASARSLLTSRPCFATLEVQYGHVVTAPAREAVRIARFLGRDLDIASMQHAVDPQLYRNRYP